MEGSHEVSEHTKPAARKAARRASQGSGRRRFRGLTCANCRARKIRCEGSQPTCKTCEAYHDECRYDKAPPVSQVLALAQRLQEAEQALAELRSDRASATPPGTNHSPPPVPEMGDRRQPQQQPQQQQTQQPTSSLPTRGIAFLGAASGAAADVASQEPSRGPLDHFTPRVRLLSTSSTSRPAMDDSMASDLTLDAHGEICYYGPTSAVHEPPDVDSPASQGSSSSTRVWSRAGMRLALGAYARESVTWEQFALGNASLETGIPRAVMAKLLHLHWTWVSPMFMWVYQPAFVRDMATGGRYYSEFLLTVICAHAAKYQDENYTDMLLARARSLLGTAIQQPSSIPTVQALLQLSARDLAQGSISQAWVYSGIAFRMASDLGLQHSGPDIKGMSAVDLNVRRRLFWGCYFWDKATSLYAGRLPAVTETLPLDTLDLLDDPDELDTWTPFYGGSVNLTTFSQNQYPPMRSYSVSCFVNSCRLAIIINDVILHLYDRRKRPLTEETLKGLKARLDAWRSQSPSHLRYEPDNLPATCPPPHHVAQNLLYYTTVILAHRPFWSIPAYYQVCISASQSIEKLILLMESTFGFNNITYLMGYCIYTGASAILEDAKAGGEAASKTLQTYLRALNAGMKKCPILERSLNIIIKGLNRSPAPPPTQHEQHHDVHIPAMIQNSFIPAFPYLGPNMSMDLDFDPYLGDQNHDTIAGLDCFPEMQMSFNDLSYPSVP